MTSFLQTPYSVDDPYGEGIAGLAYRDLPPVGLPTEQRQKLRQEALAQAALNAREESVLGDVLVAMERDDRLECDLAGLVILVHPEVGLVAVRP